MGSGALARVDALAARVIERAGFRPTVGVVLGSGLGAFGDTLDLAFPYEDLDGMPRSAVPGHAGLLKMGRVAGASVACLQGRAHLYEGHTPSAVVFGVRLLARLGCRAVLLTNAAGGIAPGLEPGDRLLISDHLNLTGRNPLAEPDALDFGERFVDLGAAYDASLAALCRTAATTVNAPIAEGVYAGLLGPSYETPAEVRMLRALGASAVGMSTVLEVIALRQLGARVGALSCITNLAAGLSKAPLDHRGVQEIAARAAAPLVALLTRWVTLVADEVGR